MFVKFASAFAVVSLLAVSSAPAQSIIGGLMDRFGGGQSQQVQQPQQVQQQQQQVPPPAEQGARKQSAGDKKSGPSSGARKLARELNWDKVPRDLFNRYAGNWEGHFWTYSPLGKKEQVNRVQVSFTPNGNTMKMVTNSMDLISKTWVVQESAVYTIEGDTVYVEITRPSGDTSRQVGHWSDDQLFLQGQINDGVEHFRERVDGGRLLVDGFGVYGSVKGKDHHIFIGRLTRK